MKIQHQYYCPIDETTIYDPNRMISRAKGSWIWFEGEHESYLDLLMGYGSTNFGHVNDDILDFVREAITKYDNITSFNSSSRVELSKKLIDLLPYPNEKIVYFPVGGTKAIDAAIKLARAYTKKEIVISFEGGFHGFSYGGLLTTDEKFVNKKQFGSLPGKNKMFSYPDSIDEKIKEKTEKILKDVEEYLNRNKDNVACILFEPIQGAAGFIVPPKEFLQGIISLCEKFNIVSICDEIQTGIYRTGSFYYINQVGINPNIVLLGKSLAGGYYPLSAVIADRKLYLAVDVLHSGFDSTFANNVFAIEVANRIVDYIRGKKINEIVKKNGGLFYKAFSQMMSNYPFISNFNRIGMAFSYKTPNVKIAKLIRKKAFDKHLIIQTAG